MQVVGRSLVLSGTTRFVQNCTLSYARDVTGMRDHACDVNVSRRLDHLDAHSEHPSASFLLFAALNAIPNCRICSAGQTG